MRRRIEMMIDTRHSHTTRMARPAKWLLTVVAALAAAVLAATPLVRVASAEDENRERQERPAARTDGERPRNEEKFPDAEHVRAQIKAAEKERESLRDKLSSIRRKIWQSDALTDLSQTAAQAEQAARDARQKNPRIIEAQKTVRAAVEALRQAQQDALKANPEAAALLRKLEEEENARADMSFQLALAEVKLRHKDSPIGRILAKDAELTKLYKAMFRGEPREAHEKARKAYEEARRAAVATIPEGKTLLKEIDLLKGATAEITEARQAIRTKLQRLRDKVGPDQESEALSAARERLRAANRALQTANDTPALKVAVAARNKARQALQEKVDDLLAKDENAAAISTTIDELKKKISALRGKAYPRPRPGPEGPRRPVPVPEV